MILRVCYDQGTLKLTITICTESDQSLSLTEVEKLSWENLYLYIVEINMVE